MKYHDTEKAVLWFLIGAGIGTLVGFLYAPKKGKETRRHIARTAGEARDYIAETSHGLYEKGRELVEDAGDLLDKGMKLVARA